MNPSSILLVEDHAAFANALLNILNKNGNMNVVAVADSAEKALEQLPELHVDLVLVDVSLPQMSGINLVAALHDALRSYVGPLRPTGAQSRRARVCAQRS